MQFTLEKNKTYRVGANAGQNHDVMLKALGQRLDINFKLIEYKNSGGIDQALAAGEIDAAWSNSGYREYIEKNKRCFYTTSAQPIAGIVPLDSVLQGKYTKAVYLAFWTVSESWVTSELSKLKKDLESIYNGDRFQKLIQIRGSYIPQLSISDQIQLIKDVSEAF
jgi:ABC-type phosphate/phosphonate transport system substrate-binding protein